MLRNAASEVVADNESLNADTVSLVSSISSTNGAEPRELIQTYKMILKLNEQHQWSTQSLNDYCVRRHKTILITVDELERAYMTDCRGAQHDLHSIGDITEERRIMCVATGSSPHLRQLAFRNFQLDVAEALLHEFPGAKHAPDLNSRKFLTLTLRPCRELPNFRNCLRVCYDTNKAHLQREWGIRPEHVGLPEEPDFGAASGEGGGADALSVATDGSNKADDCDSRSSDAASLVATDPVADTFLRCRGLVGAALALTDQADDEDTARLGFRCIDQSGEVLEPVLRLARQFWSDRTVRPLSLAEVESATSNFFMSLTDCTEWSQGDCCALSDAGVLRCEYKSSIAGRTPCLGFVHPAGLLPCCIAPLDSTGGLAIENLGSVVAVVSAAYWSL